MKLNVTREQVAQAQRIAEGLLAEGAITAEWITGIRKGWKQLAAKTKAYPGRMSSAPTMDPRDLKIASEGAVKALHNVQRYIGLLRDDLLLDKGFWDLPTGNKKKEVDLIRKLRTTVIDLLDEADEAADGALSSITALQNDLAEVDRFGNPGFFYKRAYSSQKEFNGFLQAFGLAIDDVVEKLDKIISRRLLRHLGMMAKKFGDPAGVFKRFGTHAPATVHIGRANVVFQDMPWRREKGGMISPRKIGTTTFTGKDWPETELTPLAKRHGYVHPVRREPIAQSLRQALIRLRAKRLDGLFRGNFYVRPAHYAQKFNYKKGTVAGTYHRVGDYIILYCDEPHALDAEYTIIHELGHRYYYKHMTDTERRNFDKWFGDVAAVSRYGGTNPAEDFAEVFTYYVMGRELTKPQRMRFKEFMKGERPKTEGKRRPGPRGTQKCKYCKQPADHSLIWADGRAYIPVCRAHDGTARKTIRDQGDGVCDVVKIEQQYPIYSVEDRLASAQQPIPDFAYSDEEIGVHFGQRADAARRESALSEAPPVDLGIVPLGRGAPRGVVFQQRPSLPEPRKGKKPKTLLQRLGDDWKVFRAHKVHDNRLTVHIDGERYTLYTRRG